MVVYYRNGKGNVAGGLGRVTGMFDRIDLDVDLLRRAVLELEALERSPPEPIILNVPEFATQLGCSPIEVAEILERLADLSLIEGPGSFDEAWLFRRITTKGQIFLNEVRNEARWEKIKQAYMGGW
jgi:hypothetical protein